MVEHRHGAGKHASCDACPKEHGHVAKIRPCADGVEAAAELLCFLILCPWQDEGGTQLNKSRVNEVDALPAQTIHYPDSLHAVDVYRHLAVAYVCRHTVFKIPVSQIWHAGREGSG